MNTTAPSQSETNKIARLPEETRKQIDKIHQCTKVSELLQLARTYGYDPVIMEYIPDQADEIYRQTPWFTKRSVRKDIVFVFSQLYLASRSENLLRAISHRPYLTKEEKLNLLRSKKHVKFYQRIPFVSRFFFGPTL